MARKYRKPPPRKPSAEIQAKLDHIDQLQDQIDAETDAIVASVIAPLGDDAPAPEDTVLGSYECPDERNGLARCVYDEEKDMNHDYCIFCGEPEDRH